MQIIKNPSVLSVETPEMGLFLMRLGRWTASQPRWVGDQAFACYVELREQDGFVCLLNQYCEMQDLAEETESLARRGKTAEERERLWEEAKAVSRTVECLSIALRCMVVD